MKKKQTQKNKPKAKEVSMRYHIKKAWQGFERLKSWVQIIIASAILIGIHQLINHSGGQYAISHWKR